MGLSDSLLHKCHLRRAGKARHDRNAEAQRCLDRIEDLETENRTLRVEQEAIRLG